MKTINAILEPRGSVTLDDYVVDLAWSPDARRIAVAGGEGKVFLAAHGGGSLEAREIGQHGIGTLAVAWQPQGEFFASSGQDSRITLFDGDGILQATQRPSTNWTTTLAWSPDGKRLATAAGKQVSLWTPALQTEHALAPLSATVVALGWDKPGRDLAAAINGGLAVFRIEPPLQLGCTLSHRGLQSERPLPGHRHAGRHGALLASFHRPRFADARLSRQGRAHGVER